MRRWLLLSPVPGPAPEPPVLRPTPSRLAQPAASMSPPQEQIALDLPGNGALHPHLAAETVGTGSLSFFTRIEILRLRGRGIVLYAQHLVGIAAHLGHLIGAHAVLLQQPPRGVGAVRRKIPVAVAVVGRNRAWRRCGLRSAANWAASSTPRPAAPAAPGRLRSAWRCRSIEGSVLALDQLNAQSLGRDGDLNLLGELLQFLSCLDLRFELFFQLLQLVVADFRSHGYRRCRSTAFQADWRLPWDR